MAIDPRTQDWIRRRAAAVRDVYTAYDCLCENGHGTLIPDKDTAIQISCPFHGPDNRPSARFYPALGGRPDYVRCYFCKENWNAIDLFMRFKGLKFMDALRDLERRFRIRVPERPEGSDFVEPPDKESVDYVSEAWRDVARVMPILEKKLERIRDRASLVDYVKFCRVLDAVQWDFDRNQGESTPAMILVLDKLRGMMDSVPVLDLGSGGPDG